MFLPAEWHRQAFVQLTWPHKNTDWTPMLADAIDCFCKIAHEVSQREPLLIVAPCPKEVEQALEEHKISLEHITIVETLTNDTWARDHAFITCINEKEKCVILNDFQFNGWGLKFAANHDNQINSHIFPHVASFYKNERIKANYKNCLDFVLEGGSIESDGEGTLMVTSSCLLSRNRNNTLYQKDIEDKLKHYFNIERVFWLRHSWLAGDDTDGHVDTVARFCSPTSIAYVKSTDTHDEHDTELSAMEQELKAFRTVDGKPYTLIPLPLPAPCYDDDGNRLPATYANFLIINGAVLVPTYGQPENDHQALLQLQKAFPHHQIVGIDCQTLILQHGSLHCSTMQYPLIGI